MKNGRTRDKKGVKLYLLWPVGLGVMILLTGSMFILFKLQKDNLKKCVNDHAENVSTLFYEELEHEADNLQELMILLKQDKVLEQLWLEKDRHALLNHAHAFFNEVCSNHEITHFYFHGTDQVCFLRVHQPDRHGDYIDRTTLQEAVRTGECSWGSELGPLGTLTLRVVEPWRINGKIQGYLELGREIDYIATHIHRMLGVELLLTINKDYLNQTDWEKGMVMLHRTSDWDQYKQFVVISSTLETTPKELDDYLYSLKECESEEHLDDVLFNLSLDHEKYRGKPVSLIDAKGRDVGDIFVLVNTNARELAINRLSIMLVIAYGIMFGLLFASLYFYYRKILRTLNMTYDDLNHEIDEHKESKIHIEQQNRFLNNIIESLTYPFYIVDVNTYRITLANSAAADTISPNTTCYELSHRRDTPCRGSKDPCPLDIVKKTHQPMTVEHLHYDKEGNVQNVEVHCYPIFDGNGKLTHIIEYFMDITTRKKFQQDLKTAKIKAEEASRLKSEFLANMSHEIRTPLNSIIGFSDLLMGSESLDEEQKEYADTIIYNSNLLLRLINDILDLSKIEAGKQNLEFSDFDPHTLRTHIENLMQPLIKEKDIRLTIHCADDLPHVICGDQHRIEQCLLNLASNAVKFTPTGSVDIHFYLDENLGKKYLRIDVKDTGIGIPESKLDAIFEAFMQADGSTSRKFGGTGLGLTITRKLIKLMGGELYVDSKPDVGSVFSIQLPLEPSTEIIQDIDIDEYVRAKAALFENDE